MNWNHFNYKTENILLRFSTLQLIALYNLGKQILIRVDFRDKINTAKFTEIVNSCSI